MSPYTLVSPLTVSFSPGTGVPIPTLPLKRLINKADRPYTLPLWYLKSKPVKPEYPSDELMENPKD